MKKETIKLSGRSFWEDQDLLDEIVKWSKGNVHTSKSVYKYFLHENIDGTAYLDIYWQ